MFLGLSFLWLLRGLWENARHSWYLGSFSFLSLFLLHYLLCIFESWGWDWREVMNICGVREYESDVL